MHNLSPGIPHPGVQDYSAGTTSHHALHCKAPPRHGQHTTMELAGTNLVLQVLLHQVVGLPLATQADVEAAIAEVRATS